MAPSSPSLKDLAAFSRSFAPFIASALIVLAAGCSESGGGECAVKVNNPQQFVIDDDYENATRSDQHDWNTTASVARVEVEGHDFHHGDFRIRAIDAVGNEVLDVLYFSWDNFWYVGDNEFYDLRFTVQGVPGRWTLIFEFDEFTCDLKITFEDNLTPPDTGGGGNPPLPSNPLLDSTFGHGGVVRYTPDKAFGVDVAVDSQDRVVTSGTIIDENGNRHLAVWRMLSNGGFDPAFGSGGLFQLLDGSESQGSRLAIANGDAVLVTGLRNGGTEVSDIAVVKLTSSGALDGSFGTGGIVTIDDGKTERGAGITIDPDNKIVVAGTSRNGNNTNSKILVARLLPGGLPDNTFGIGGIRLSSGPADSARGLVVDSLHRPTVLGQRGNGILIWRLNISGNPDAVFGSNGEAERAPSPGITWLPLGIARRISDGYLGIAGVETVEGFNAPPAKMAVWLYSVDGQPVANFSGDGMITYQFNSGTAGGAAVGFDLNSKLLVVGGTGNLDGDTAATLWRINTNGTLDTTLPGGGVARFDNPDGGDRAVSIGMTVDLQSQAVFAAGIFHSNEGGYDMSTWKLKP